MKAFQKAILYFVGTAVVIAIAFIASLFIFKDRIIEEFIKEANKSLSTPIKIGKIEISAWNDFPNLAIVFTDVYVEDSHPEEYPLLTAKAVSFYLNPIEAWNGNYSIRGLQVLDSETNLKINAVGKSNFTIVKESKGSSGSISFHLRNVRLVNTKVNYHDQQIQLDHIFSSEMLMASISTKNDVYEIVADGDVLTEQIGIGKNIYLKNKKFDVKTQLAYDDLKKTVDINSSTLKVNVSTFDLSGNYTFKQKNIIDITAIGKDTNIQTLLSLLPDELGQKLKQYESNGDIYFNLNLKGEISDQKSPFISASFGCRDATVFHPDYKSKIENANLEGSFASPSFTELSNAELLLKNISGDLNGKAFTANIGIQNLEDPYLSFDFKGDLDATDILNFYLLPEIREFTGKIKADFTFEGQVSLLKRKATAQQVFTSGSIEMNQVNFSYGKQEIHVKDLNGTFQFNNKDLALSNVSGRFENSDFLLNGFFKNIVTFLFFDDQPVGIETDLKSDFLDVDQLFSIGFTEESSDYNFSISPNLHLNFNCDIRKLKYKRFTPTDVKGDLLVKNQVAVSRNIALRAMGGDLTLNGIVDAKNPKAIEVVSAFQLNGIHVDSIFYVFENFHQDFIEDKHLKGQTSAEVLLEMTLTEKLKLVPETLIADITATIKNGELNNFEPLQDLKKYLDDETLARLRFADLINDIHIEKSTIYIPQMEIRSNATTLQLSGTHTFDQKIDYRVIAPLRNKKKIDPDESFGAIEEDKSGRAKIFLKIIGTADEFDVSYDKAALKKKLGNDMKKEVQELKDAFRLKGKKKKKELEVEKDEYFDWEN
ncbi:MAG: AsmA-like C-terminal region-containing protein [Bacteroidota bacterium]